MHMALSYFRLTYKSSRYILTIPRQHKPAAIPGNVTIIQLPPYLMNNIDHITIPEQIKNEKIVLRFSISFAVFFMRRSSLLPCRKNLSTSFLWISWKISDFCG